MKKIIAQGQNDWVQSVSKWLVEKKQLHQATSLYIPAGATPTLIYQDWELQKPAFLNNLKLIQIDDVVSGEKKDMFKFFFRKELPSFIGQIEFFDEGATQADLAILGLGMNGHIAFHEPELPTNFYSGCVELAAETRKNLSIEEHIWGKTYGIGAFLKCKSLLLIVNGEKKKSILQKTVKQLPTVPASALLTHKDLTILSDFEF
jgi:6-phosphogluconolactonase/glucosamine-6-phosphate isomerase/deaminase